MDEKHSCRHSFVPEASHFIGYIGPFCKVSRTLAYPPPGLSQGKAYVTLFWDWYQLTSNRFPKTLFPLSSAIFFLFFLTSPSHYIVLVHLQSDCKVYGQLLSYQQSDHQIGPNVRRSRPVHGYPSTHVDSSYLPLLDKLKQVSNGSPMVAPQIKPMPSGFWTHSIE